MNDFKIYLIGTVTREVRSNSEAYAIGHCRKNLKRLAENLKHHGITAQHFVADKNHYIACNNGDGSILLKFINGCNGDLHSWEEESFSPLWYLSERQIYGSANRSIPDKPFS